MADFALNNPNTGKQEETFQRIADSDRDGILDRSTAAFKEWSATSIDERAAVLARTADLYEERAEELAEHIGREMGKLTRWGKAEISIVADIYRYYAEHAPSIRKSPINSPRVGCRRRGPASVGTRSGWPPSPTPIPYRCRPRTIEQCAAPAGCNSPCPRFAKGPVHL